MMPSINANDVIFSLFLLSLKENVKIFMLIEDGLRPTELRENNQNNLLDI